MVEVAKTSPKQHNDKYRHTLMHRGKSEREIDTEREGEIDRHADRERERNESLTDRT